MNELEKIKIWEELKAQTNKIQDQKTRNLYYRAFLSRCIDEWGFNPENPASGQKNTAIVDDWEKEFVNDINDALTYGIDTREDKRKETEKQARASMRQMIRNGETLDDIPEDIRTPHIEKLFLGEMINYADELIKCADDLIDKPKEL